MDQYTLPARAHDGFRLLSLTLIKSYRVTVFAMVMLCIALIAGALGLSAVLGLQQVNQPASNEMPWFEPQAYHQLQAQSGQRLTVADITQIKSKVPFPVVSYVSDAIDYNGEITIDVLALDSLAILSGRPFLNLTATDAIALTQANLFGQGVLLNPNTFSLIGGEWIEHYFQGNRFDWLTDDALADNLLIMDLGVWTTVRAHWELSGAFILSSDNASLAEISDALPDHVRLIEPAEQFSATQLSNSFQLNLLAMGLLMFAVCLFIVINATNLLLHKRLHMFVVLRQLGFARNTIVVSLFFEMTLIVIFCVMVGTLVGYDLVRWLTRELDAVIFVDLKLSPSLSSTLLIVFCIAWTGVVCACTPFFIRLRDSLATAKHHPSSRPDILWASAAFLIIISVACFLVFSTLWVMLFATACLILGLSILMLWLLPLVIALMSDIVSKKSYISSLLLQSALSLTQQTRLAFCAFFIAITSNMAMNIMVDSFRGATEQWLQQRLVSEAYLYVDSVNTNTFYRNSGLSESQLTPRFVSRQVFKDTQIQVYSYPTTATFQQAMLFSNALPDVWQRFSATSQETLDGVLVNQQFLHANQFSLGEVFTMRDPVTQQSVAVTIAGVFYDYGNPRGQVLLPTGYFLGQSIEADLFAVNGLALPDIESALGDMGIAFDYYLSEDLIALSMQEFDNTFVITDALNVVTLLVAALSLACTVSVLLDNTRAERFLFRSLGFSSRQILTGNILQYGMLLVLACVLAIPSGAVVAWVLIHQINFAAFFWTYPLTIQVQSILPVVFISVLIVLSTLYLPLRITSKKSLSEELSWLD